MAWFLYLLSHLSSWALIRFWVGENQVPAGPGALAQLFPSLSGMQGLSQPPCPGKLYLGFDISGHCLSTAPIHCQLLTCLHCSLHTCSEQDSLVTLCLQDCFCWRVKQRLKYIYIYLYIVLYFDLDILKITLKRRSFCMCKNANWIWFYFVAISDFTLFLYFKIQDM